MATTKVVMLVLMFFSHVPTRSRQNQRKLLYIGGLFDIDTTAGGWNSGAILPAVQMAFEDIHNATNVLPGYRLTLLAKDVKCNVGEAVRAEIDYLLAEETKIMLIGPGCSKSAQPIAESIHHWNLVQVAFAAASPLLSNKEMYPTFFRTNPPEQFSNVGRLAIVKRFHWKRVAILQQNNDIFSGMTNSLVDILKKNNISVVAFQSFRDNPKNHIEQLKSKDARIIYGFFYEPQARHVFCEAFKQGMYGSKYVWILVSARYHLKWWEINQKGLDCTAEEVRKGLGNYIGTEELKISDDPRKTISGKTPKQLWKKYISRTHNSKYGLPNSYASFGYDAAWTCALTLNASLERLKDMNMSLEDFKYNNTRMRKVFTSIMRGLDFPGMSGQIKFDKNFDRITKLEITQLQGEQMQRVALYDMKVNSYKDDMQNKYIWEGNKVPTDGLKVMKEEVTIHPALFWVASSLSLVGIIAACLFLSYNLHFRNVRHIKMSSPQLNNLIVLGCVLIYIAEILTGMEAVLVFSMNLKYLCQTKLWFLSLGFTLAFGAMFSKTWRVHKIFLNRTERTVIRDRQLFGMVAGMVLIDLVTLTSWQNMDPLQMHLENLEAKTLEEDNDIVIQPVIRHCYSQHITIWSAVMFAYKGILLLFGTYLAWETRKVHIPALNDSKLIGMSVYNVIIPCVCIIPILTVVQNMPTVHFVLVSVLVIFCTTCTLCMVFLPKILYLRNNDGNHIPRVTAVCGVQETREMDQKEPTTSSRTHIADNNSV